jgi:hypothetical protein
MARFLEDDDSEAVPREKRSFWNRGDVSLLDGQERKEQKGVTERFFGICKADPKRGREASNVIHPQSPFATGLPPPPCHTFAAFTISTLPQYSSSRLSQEARARMGGAGASPPPGPTCEPNAARPVIEGLISTRASRQRRTLVRVRGRAQLSRWPVLQHAYSGRPRLID